jgi:hypothetical protein
VEWKARLDLAWYAVSGCAALDGNAISGYSNPESDGMGWAELFSTVIKEHDDGHASKFIRALKNGEEMAARFEQGEWKTYFPMKGDMWLKLARVCQDTTKNLPTDLKVGAVYWIRAAVEATGLGRLKREFCTFCKLDYLCLTRYT